MRPPRPFRPAACARGLTLVELMVGLVLGMFAIAVVGMVYVGSLRTYTSQEAGARLQENVRLVSDMLAGDLRMGGFRGCAGPASLVNTLNRPGDLANDFARPVWGAHPGAGGWVPALAAPVAALAPSARGDVPLIRRPVAPGWSLTGTMASPEAAVGFRPTAAFARGDILLVSDCAAAAVLQATNDAPGPAGEVLHAAGVPGLLPGVATANLGRAFAADAMVWRLQALVYHLADSQRQPGRSALWLLRQPAYDGAEALTEVASGVDAMVVQYALDSDADGSADRVVPAAQVGDWRQVVGVRVELLLSSEARTATSAAQPYTFDGTTVTPQDRRLRSVAVVSASLRNALP